MKILAFIQHENGNINPVSLEALKGAQDIAKNVNGSIKVVTFGPSILDKLIKYNISEIIQIDNTELNNYNSLYYVKAMEEIINQENPNIIIFGHTYEARDWVPRLSARLDIPFISDCINFNYTDTLSYTRSVYQGKMNIDIIPNTDKYIISFQSGAFKTDNLDAGNSNQKILSLELSNIPNIINTEDKFQESKSDIDLTQAEIIVSIGRGIGKEENISIARELSKYLKAELASSRPIVDSGWLESYHQIGSSGQNVSPKLYFALGISGAIQHVVGMKGSKNIMAINKDPNAPIFEIADYGIIGDVLEIVPEIINLLKTN